MSRPLIYPLSNLQSVELPFERFLPLDPPGMMSRWISREISAGSTILDPIGASPRAILETAAAGYRIIAACNNPVLAFEISLLASPPKAEAFKSLIFELGDQRKGKERLETTIQNLYLTSCARCGAEIQARGFIWRRGESVPHARLYECPNCGDNGLHPITDEDILRLQVIQRSEPLHRSRAIARATGSHSENREAVSAALNIYPVRSLYVLFTLMNKLETMRLNESQKRLADALLLSLLDAGHAIWFWPEERDRPRQFSKPAQFIEKNLWLEFENAINAWTVNLPELEVTEWPNIPGSVGICLYPGRMRDLVQPAKAIGLDALMCVFPRPNQAFWTLCSLWSSWLWGEERAGQFSQVIERRRFDWYWHSTALHAALLPAARLSNDKIPFLGLVPEPSAGMISAVIESAALSGFDLIGCAVQDSVKPVLIQWQKGVSKKDFAPVNTQKIARDAMRCLLHDLNEPGEYLKIHTAAMTSLAEASAFPQSIHQFTYEKFMEVQTSINTLLDDAGFLRRMKATAQDPESGLWWLAQPDVGQTPLADKLEFEILSWLQNSEEQEEERLLERVYQNFSGFLTPTEELIQQCLASYADKDNLTRKWKLRRCETPREREKDIAGIFQMVGGIASTLRVRQEEAESLYWYPEKGGTDPIYQLIITNSATIERKLLHERTPNCETIIILPGSRAGLMKYKLERDPYLQELLADHAHFLKFRTLRSIASRVDLTRDIWSVLIDTDPISLGETTQLSVFR